MKKLYWKFRFARHFRRLVKVSFLDAFNCAGAALENIDNDISESPIYCAEEEYYAWADACK